MKTLLHTLNTLLCTLARLIILTYQYTLSPLISNLCGPQSGCRHTPTCSRYAIESYRRHPFHRATALTLKRISHCHPLHKGGHDPVPPPRASH